MCIKNIHIKRHCVYTTLKVSAIISRDAKLVLTQNLSPLHLRKKLLYKKKNVYDDTSHTSVLFVIDNKSS